ncbi:MAG: PorT family protein [Bacteroidales bacterium]|nr:PorT family protein [Bacteroidales bacterium]
MKKVFLISSVIVLLAFGSTRAFAQSFNAGLIVGPTFCQVDGDSYYGFHQLGFTAGAYVNLPLVDQLSAQMELKYSLLGAHSSDKEVREYGYLPYSLRLHYAEIPLMLQYNLSNFRVGGRPLDFITLEAGASVDVRLRATEDVDADYQVTTSRWNLLSATANAGVHFAFNDHFGLGARFMYSAAPCRFTGNPGWFFNQYYNKVIQFTLTYNINSPLR